MQHLEKSTGFLSQIQRFLNFGSWNPTGEFLGYGRGKAGPGPGLLGLFGAQAEVLVGLPEVPVGLLLPVEPLSVGGALRIDLFRGVKWGQVGVR